MWFLWKKKNGNAFLLYQVHIRDGRRSDGLPRSMSLDSNQPPSDNLYTDVSGTRLEPFFIETLGKSSQDRTFLLRLEQDLTDYVLSGRWELWVRLEKVWCSVAHPVGLDEQKFRAFVTSAVRFWIFIIQFGFGLKPRFWFRFQNRHSTTII